MDDSTTIVLIPGLMCDAAVWAGQIGALSRLGPVHLACNDGAESLAEMAMRVLAATTGPLAVVGHSMGGRIALELAAQAPARVRKLALLSTGAHGARAHEHDERMALVRLAHREGMAAVARAWMPGMIGMAASDGIRAAVEAMLLRATPEVFAAQQQALLDRPDRTALLGALHCPVLYATGAVDGWASPKQHSAMAETTPGARLAIIAGAGHMVTMEAAEEITALLAGFLTDSRDL